MAEPDPDVLLETVAPLIAKLELLWIDSPPPLTVEWLSVTTAELDNVTLELPVA